MQTFVAKVAFLGFVNAVIISGIASLQHMDIAHYIARKTSAVSEGAYTRWIVRLAIGTIALSVVVMILADVMMRGFEREISQKIFGLWGHIHIYNAGLKRSYEMLPIHHDTKLYNAIKRIRRVRVEQLNPDGERSTVLYSKAGVRHIQRIIMLPAVLSRGDEFEGLYAKGIAEDFDTSFLARHLVRGKMLRIPTDTTPPREVLISSYTAQRLELDTGDYVVMYLVRKHREYPVKLQIVGIFNTGLREYDMKLAFVSMVFLQKALGWGPDQIGEYEVFVERFEDMDLISQYIYEEVLPLEMWSETVRERFPNIFEWLSLQTVNKRVILSLMLVVAVLNMMTMVLILILERAYMIGVLSTLGMKVHAIRRIFLYYGLRILIRGMIIGNVLATAIAYLQDKYHFIRLREEDYYLSYAPVWIDWWSIALINLMVLVVVGLFLWLPTWWVTKIQPTKILRFE